MDVSVVDREEFERSRTALASIRRSEIITMDDAMYRLEGFYTNTIILKYGEFIRRWEEKRVRGGIRKRVLVSNKSKEWLSYYGMQKLVDIRTISNSLYINMSINIYGSKVVLILWAREPTYILIEGKEISKNFRSYFEMLWRKSQKPRI